MTFLSITLLLLALSITAHFIVRVYWYANGTMMLGVFVYSFISTYKDMQGDIAASTAIAMVMALIALIVCMIIGIPFYVKRQMNQ